MRVEVKEQCLVVVTPAYNVVYEPGVHVAPRTHIDEIERQGKGKRLKSDAADAGDAPQGDSVK